MAKAIKYKFLVGEVNHGTEEVPNIEPILSNVVLGWNETNEETAKREAYNGEYTIEDDGQLEPEVQPTTDDVLNALLGVTE